MSQMAPGGALVKRAERDPVDDADFLNADFDAFYQGADQFPTRGGVGFVEAPMNAVGEIFQMVDHHPQLLVTRFSLQE